jgi:hypothetical protein
MPEKLPLCRGVDDFPLISCVLSCLRRDGALQWGGSDTEDRAT